MRLDGQDTRHTYDQIRKRERVADPEQKSKSTSSIRRGDLTRNEQARRGCNDPWRPVVLEATTWSLV